MHEKISGKRIVLKRPACTMKTAETIYAVIDKCREAFVPWLGWVKDTHAPNDTLKFLEMVKAAWEKLGCHVPESGR